MAWQKKEGAAQTHGRFGFGPYEVWWTRADHANGGSGFDPYEEQRNGADHADRGLGFRPCEVTFFSSRY